MTRIVFDVQTLQEGSRFRGIGRATIEILKALAEIGNGEIRLFALHNAAKAFPADVLADMERIGIKFIQFYPYEDQSTDSEICQEISEKIKAMVVKSYNPDLYIGPHVFERFQKPIYAKAIDGIKNGSFFYDAIPLLFPEIYLRTNELMEWYSSRMNILQEYDEIYALSRASADEAIDLMKIEQSKVKVIGGGFRKSDQFSSSKKNEEDLTFLYFGAFDLRKNVKLIIESFAEFLRLKNRNARLVLAGHVQDYSIEIAPLEDLARKLNVFSNVEFRGYIPNDKIASLFSEADLFIQASIAEGLGLGLLDAVSYGVPAIALDIPSSREVLGDNSFYFNNDVKSLAKLMCEMTDDISLRVRYTSTQYEHAKGLTWELAASRLINELMIESGLNNNNPVNKVRMSYLEVLQQLSASRYLSSLNLELLSEMVASNFSLTYKDIFTHKSKTELDLNTLLIEGHFEGSYSLSILNREFTSEMKAIYPATNSREIYFEPGSNSFMLKRETSLSTYQKAEIVSRNVYPPLAHDMDGMWNFFHCFNWEETEFPKKYVMEFNYFLDGVSCASSEVQKALIDSGVRIPTQVVPLARREPDRHPFQQLSKGSDFTFLHISSGFPRKGVDVLLKAFHEEFKNNSEVRLIIKTFSNPHQNVMHLISELTGGETANRILLIEEEYAEKDIYSLYENADCLVQPSRGEGFGLPILEAMSAGLKVIATKWGGQMDFYSDANNYGVKYEMNFSKSHVGSEKSLWAEPNLDDLRLQMRKVFSEGKYKKKRRPVTHSWRDSADEHLSFISEVITRETKEPKIAWLSSWDTRCGIAEYSRDLLNYFDISRVKVFAPHDANVLDRNITIDKIRCWSPGLGGIEELISGLKAYEPNVIIIQFNLGFFSLNQIRELLSETNQYIQIIEIHSLRNQQGVPHESIMNLLPELSKVERLLVHNLQDFRYLHELGLASKSVLFPHPIPNFGHNVSHRIFKSDKLVIGTSGFALPHKGHIELISAARQLAETGVKIELRLFTPEHPDPSSRDYLTKISKMITPMRNLTITLDETFHKEEDLIQLLSSCDLLVYPHQVTGEAASGTVHHGLASGRPVLVTPSSIFEDTSQCLYFTEGFGATEIANSILDLVTNLTGTTTESEKVVAIKQKLRNQNFGASARRLEDMATGLLNVIQKS